MMNKNAVTLTAEQKARIEHNRKQALERLEARKLAESTKSTTEINSINNSVTKVLPTKALASSHRVNPYLKPPEKCQSSYQKPKNWFQKESTLIKPIHCSIELINEDRFLVKTNGGFNQNLVGEFKKIPSQTYNAATKHWSFRIPDYDQLIKGLDSLKNINVTCSKIPNFVIKALHEETRNVDERTCLEQIDGTLVSTLLDFQKSGICFGINKKGRCMIADDMGLGKSRQAIGIADFYRDDWPLLIITNASTRQFWSKEIQNLLPSLSSNDIRIFQGNPDDASGNDKVVICSYNNLQTSMDNLMRTTFGVIIFDESHNLKNEKAKQTMNAETISKSARRIIMLTGTPALSRPVELFAQLNILDRNFANYYQFTSRYCNGRQSSFGWNVSGCSNLEELNILLKKKFLIRRIKSDVFLELSAKNRVLVYLENYKYTTSYDDEMRELCSQFSEANMNHKFSENILLSWYQLTSKVKAYGASLFVRRFLEENNCKTLIFFHHNFMMNAICAEIDKTNIPYIQIDGKVSGSDRAKRVEEFQTNPNIKAAVLSIRACNAGITLTAASTVIFCEFDWNPSSIIQAEARAHRIGQENEVKVYFLMANNTSDNKIWQLLINKQDKLGMAGLVANVENLGDGIKTKSFDVQEAKNFIENTQRSNKNNKEKFFMNLNSVSQKVDYFEDDDIDDEEMLKLLENLP